ncbi:hypothetical protein F3Y22_tig00110472pilonHSYRG00309 [Hibiscus syriacus]|uniref:Protein kinase domain-containing protein n=1 Tax=Hibiscus syriacus TaxID=106335 RepID=A0A6A3AFH5_HIBSY|nr:hypothetical protein F3Y22_tig00110472pilonHSYRG00309 [Hibiscus syriacus]
MAITFLNLVLLIIFHSSMTTFSLKSTTIVTDQSALLELKNHISHDPENVLATNWSVSTPVCNWFGVSCGSKHRRVTALDLTGLGLVGTLPPHLLGNLSFLSLFSIRNNSFHGTLPVQLSNLHRLKHLVFGNTASVEKSHRGNLSKPEKLSYQIIGSIPSSIFNISSLQVFFLYNNMLTGSIPSVSRDLPSLKYIDFSFNNLTGHIPKEMFDHLPNLKILFLSVNRLSGGIPANLFKGRELQVLSISYNQLEGKLQGEIGNLSKLQCLAIDHNHFQGNASKLTLLEMSSNYFSGSIPNDLGNLRNLRSLNLEENNLISLEMRFLSSLTNCRGLEKLKFGHNPLISGELPGLLGNLSGSLQIFYGFRCNISGRIPSELGNLSSLIRVELANNKLAGSIPPTIGRLKELQGLSLEDNKLEGAFKSFDVECEVLRNIRHRNLIKIISSCSNDFDFKALVLEFMPNGSLDKWLYSDNHSLDILQSNVLLDEDMVARLSDFGIAKLLCNEDSMNQTMTMATIGYMAPEYGIDGIVSTKGDVYSFVGLECSAEVPDERNDMKEIVIKLKKIKVKFLDDIKRKR